MHRDKKKHSGLGKKIAKISVALTVFGVILAALIVAYFTGFLEKVLTPTEQAVSLSDDTVC